MPQPRLTGEQLWDGIRRLHETRRTIYSLEQRRPHTICELDEERRRYRVRYPSGNRMWVMSDRLYALYREVYARGELRGSDLDEDDDYCVRVFGKRTWHAPGRAMFSVLPLLDDQIRWRTEGRNVVLYANPSQ